jgi:hypothetical protein
VRVETGAVEDLIRLALFAGGDEELHGDAAIR